MQVRTLPTHIVFFRYFRVVFESLAYFPIPAEEESGHILNHCRVDHEQGDRKAGLYLSPNFVSLETPHAWEKGVHEEGYECSYDHGKCRPNEHVDIGYLRHLLLVVNVHEEAFLGDEFSRGRPYHHRNLLSGLVEQLGPLDVGAGEHGQKLDMVSLDLE